MSPQEVLEDLTVNHKPAEGLSENNTTANWRLQRGWQLGRGRGQLLGRGWGWDWQLLITILLGNGHRHWVPTSKTQKKIWRGTLSRTRGAQHKQVLQKLPLQLLQQL